MHNSKFFGHLKALICVTVWGSTFIVSKGLMSYLNPVQLMFVRFVLAYAAMWILCPKWFFRWREEWRFLVLALFSNTIYYWAENTALTLTQTTNVSILVSTAPIFTAVILACLHKEDRLTKRQISGFALAFCGVVLVVFNGSVSLTLNVTGDLLALLAAVSWAIYGIFLRKWTDQYDNTLITRKLMFYGILTVLPLLTSVNNPVNTDIILTLPNILRLLYLSLVGNAACYLLWGAAVKQIGVLNANLYIYMVPLVTLLVSAVTLDESVTTYGFLGILCVIIGMVLGTFSKESAT